MQCEVRPPPSSKTQPKIHSVSNSQRPKLSLQREKQRCEAGSRRGLGKMTNVLSLRWPVSALAKQKPLRIDKSPNAAIRDYSDSKPRMHSLGTVWWSSCLRFKRCTVVPNSSCRHLADFDDDTLAKTWLHDVNTTLGKGTQSFIGMPV